MYAMILSPYPAIGPFPCLMACQQAFAYSPFAFRLFPLSVLLRTKNPRLLLKIFPYCYC